MLFVDVNVLIYAHRPESPRHLEYRDWLDAARVGDEPTGLADVVAAGFARIVTNHKVFVDPTPAAVAVDFIDVLRSSPSILHVSPGDRVWPIFGRVVRSTESKGNQIADAFIAAMAIEQSATLVSSDRGFSRFPDLSWRHPLAAV